jgi:adenosine kinase
MFDRDLARCLVGGAKYLFTNEYELELLVRTTEWSTRDIADRVELRITTLSGDGCVLADSNSGDEIHVNAVPAREIIDPTGVGDAFRGGFLAGIAGGLRLERAAQLGSLVATLVLETSGTQEWRLDVEDAVTRLAETYGAAAAGDILTLLRSSQVASAV